jgi:AbrB family looped-hinge helix DNA binding protein
MSSRGQVVIPVEARNNLNIKEGDILSCYVEEGQIIIKTKSVKIKKGIVDETFGLLSDLDCDMKEHVEQLRKDSGRRLDAQ